MAKYRTLHRALHGITPFELQEFAHDVYLRLERRFDQTGCLNEGDVLLALLDASADEPSGEEPVRGFGKKIRETLA